MQKIVITIFVLCFTNLIHSQSIEKSSIDNGGASVSAGGLEIVYTIGEVNVQELSIGTIQLSEGFINPEECTQCECDPSFCTDCLGDANLDGFVNVLDLISVSSSFGCAVGCYGNGDANFDGVVNILDLITVSTFFNVPCP